jgi:hypothetical protein
MDLVNYLKHEVYFKLFYYYFIIWMNNYPFSNHFFYFGSSFQKYLFAVENNF